MFTQIPDNLSSLYSELIYTYYSSSSSDMTIQIYEDETDELIGVKKFYSTNTAQINIAPHIRPYAMPSIDSYSMGFITPYRNANLSVYLRMDEDNAQSTVRQFTLARAKAALGELLSTQPLVRSIADGESDQLYIAAASGDVVTVEVKRYLSAWSASYEQPYLGGEYSDNLYSSTSYTTTPSDGNIEIFNFVAQSSASGDGEQIEKTVVSITQNSELIAEVVYHVVERPAEAMRLAWLSESGSIEHYTFPVVKQLVVDGDFAHTVTLISAYEGYAMRAALAEIVRSSKVWIFDGGEYLVAQVADSSISVDSTTALGCVDIKISYND